MQNEKKAYKSIGLYAFPFCFLFWLYGCRGNGWQPLGCRFLPPKSDGKTATVPMRWTPAGAAAPDPEMRPPYDGLFTGLGAGE